MILALRIQDKNNFSNLDQDRLDQVKGFAWVNKKTDSSTARTLQVFLMKCRHLPFPHFDRLVTHHNFILPTCTASMPRPQLGAI
jgi:hypothetical protein